MNIPFTYSQVIPVPPIMHGMNYSFPLRFVVIQGSSNEAHQVRFNKGQMLADIPCPKSPKAQQEIWLAGTLSHRFPRSSPFLASLHRLFLDFVPAEYISPFQPTDLFLSHVSILFLARWVFRFAISTGVASSAYDEGNVLFKYITWLRRHLIRIQAVPREKRDKHLPIDHSLE